VKISDLSKTSKYQNTTQKHIIHSTIRLIYTLCSVISWKVRSCGLCLSPIFEIIMAVCFIGKETGVHDESDFGHDRCH
jgi:hypothetical protein